MLWSAMRIGWDKIGNDGIKRDRTGQNGIGQIGYDWMRLNRIENVG